MTAEFVSGSRIQGGSGFSSNSDSCRVTYCKASFDSVVSASSDQPERSAQKHADVRIRTISCNSPQLLFIRTSANSLSLRIFHFCELIFGVLGLPAAIALFSSAADHALSAFTLSPTRNTMNSGSTATSQTNQHFGEAKKKK